MPFHFDRSNSMKFNTLRSEDGIGYQSDTLDSRFDNTSMDSSSYIRRNMPDAATKQSLNKSCNSLDQNSGLNLYSLHSIFSYAFEKQQSSSKNHNTPNPTSNHKVNAKKQRNNTNNKKYHYNLNNFTFGGRKFHNLRLCQTLFDKHNVKRKTVLVKRLPYVKNYSFRDDSLNDVLVEYINVVMNIRQYIHDLTFRQLSLLGSNNAKVNKNNESLALSSIIQQTQLRDFLAKDFKFFNFDLNYQNYLNTRKQSQVEPVERDFRENILESYRQSVVLF